DVRWQRRRKGPRRPPGWRAVERGVGGRSEGASTVSTVGSGAVKPANGPHSFWTCHWRRRLIAVAVSTRSPPPLGSPRAYPTVMRPWKAMGWLQRTAGTDRGLRVQRWSSMQERRADQEPYAVRPRRGIVRQVSLDVLSL